MDYLTKIRDLKEDKPEDMDDQLWDICSEMEELLGADEMWRLLKPHFGIDEFAENLECIAKDADI